MKLMVVGIGPGVREELTLRAWEALKSADCIVGYDSYIERVRTWLPEKRYIASSMRKEVERCRCAIEEALSGNSVALVSSGDPGVYGMASLALELAEGRGLEVEVIPGVTAALGGAALLGSPLGHDFAVISLSDWLTPWEQIEARIASACRAGLGIALYNPRSHKRPDALQRACDVALGILPPETVCGIAARVAGAAQESHTLTLAALRDYPADMQTTAFIGTESTRLIDGRMVTPRGYEHA